MNDALEQLTELPAELAEYVEEAKKPIDAPEVKPEEITDVVVDPVVEKASKSGWTDKETWVAAGKDADEWIDAKEFVSRKPLYDKIHSQSKAIKERDDKLEAVSKYAAKAQELGYNKAVKELQAQKLDAVERGDVVSFQEAEKQLEEIEKEFKPPVVDTPAEPDVPPVVQEFAKRNEKWFEKDKAMTRYMVAETQELTAKGVPLDEALKLAEQEVRKEFAHKFVNPNKEKPSAVVANNSDGRPKTHGYSDLTQAQRLVYSSLKGKMSLDEFISDLKELGELK